MKWTTSCAPALLALLIAATTTSSATADWHEFVRGIHVGYARNNAWPDPFTEVDAYQVIAPFEAMKANGWKMHNTIGHELFRQGDGALLASGHRRVHWIATQAPQSRRTVHVLRGATPQETQARIAAVRQSLPTDVPAPQVLVTNREPSAASGAWATKINREWLEHLARPELPRQSASGEQAVATPSAAN